MNKLLPLIRTKFLGINSMIDTEISSLNGMFEPKSIAIIGASNNPDKLGSIVIKNIINSGFEGEVIPLNPKESKIQGLKVYSKYSNLEIIPDLAVIAIPAKSVLNVIEEIRQKGTNNIVIFSAGFKEIGEEGGQLENKIISLAKKFGINILGPNCLGFVNTDANINVTFGDVSMQPGKLRFISQSGAIATSIFDWSKDSEVGFSKFVTIGNKAVITENEVLAYFRDNPIDAKIEPGESSYQPIGMYLESITDGKEFIEITRDIGKTDPVFVLKPGKSNEAQKAMQSHTGAIAGEDYIFDAAMKKAGILRCSGTEDFYDMSKAFAWEQAPEGVNIAIISNAGGPAVLTSDFVSEYGLNLLRFDEETKKELADELPLAASVLNPIDVLGDALAERYKSAIETVISNDDVHSLLIILTPQIMTEVEDTATIIGEMSLKYGKPIFCSFMGGTEIEKGEKILNKYKIPSFRYPERAVKVISEMYNWNAKKDNLVETVIKVTPNTVSQKIIGTAVSNKVTSLGSVEIDTVLKEYGINTPNTKKCEDISETKSFVAENDYPVVLKISSPEVLHKTDLGGVIVGIDSEEMLNASYSNLEEIITNLENPKGSYIQIQQQVASGIEMLIGSKFDSKFGTVMMFGSGGIYANLFEDRNLGLIPLNDSEIRALVENSKVNKLLSGFRGEEAYDLEKIVDLIKKIQKLIIAHPEIKELDLNPVIINKNDIWAVDGKILFHES